MKKSIKKCINFCGVNSSKLKRTNSFESKLHGLYTFKLSPCQSLYAIGTESCSVFYKKITKKSFNFIQKFSFFPLSTDLDFDFILLYHNDTMFIFYTLLTSLLCFFFGIIFRNSNYIYPKKFGWSSKIDKVEKADLVFSNLVLIFAI